MKFLILALTFSSFSSALYAETKTFAACSGDHHGTYVDFLSDMNNENVFIQTSNDGDEPPQKFKITNMFNFDVNLDVKDYSSAVKNAIKASNGDGDYDGVLYVEAESGSDRLLLNLNKFTGENFLVLNKYVEALECPTDAVID